MKRIAAALSVIVLVSLLQASAARAGGAFAGGAATGKISGPAVSATIVIDPTFGSPTIGETGIRLSKGTLFSGAVFHHLQAGAPAPTGWVWGCDSVNGADPNAFGFGTFDVNTLTALRFLNIRVPAWMPAGVVSPLFQQLGITLDPIHNIPVITDIENPICTPIVDTDTSATKFILSFTATVQFEDSTK